MTENEQIEAIMETIENQEEEIKKIKEEIKKIKEAKEEIQKEEKGEEKMENLSKEFRAGNLAVNELSKNEVETLEKELFIRSFRAIGTGNTTALQEYQEFRATNLNEGNDGKNNGGLAVPTVLYDSIISKVLETSVLLDKVEVSYVPGNLELLYDDSDIIVQWAGDNVNRDLSETPKFSNITLKPKLATIRVEISKLLLNVSAFNLESYIIEKVSNVLALEFDKMIANGTGVNQPTGIITAMKQKKQSIEASYESVVNMVRSSLEAPYAQRAIMFLGRKTLAKMDNITDKNDRPIFQTSGYNDSFNGNILGVPTIVTDIIPEDTIIYGDLNDAYKMNIALEMDITNYDTAVLGSYNQGYLFATAADGNVVNPNSVTVVDFKKKVK